MKTTRRQFLKRGAYGCAAAAAFPYLSFGAVANAERKQLANRKRRIIFNDDGDDVWAPEAATPEGFVGVRLIHMRGTQADTLFYCTTQSFNYFTHATNVGEVFTKQEGPFEHNNMRVLMERGTDPLKLAVEFAHANGYEAFWTLRMNDIHDAFTPPLWPQWKTEHPETVLGVSGDWTSAPPGGQRRWGSGVDFALQSVRDRAVALVAEVARNYDVDGIDLDWMRHPIFFKETLDAQPATPEHAAALTDVVRQCRKHVEDAGAERGRPMLLSVRVPLTVEKGLYIGVDTGTWLAEELPDFVTTGGGYIPFSMPVREVAALAAPREIPVYPCISCSGMLRRAPYGPGIPYSIEGWRGAAANAFRNGGAGISLFNLFPAPGQDGHNAFVRAVFSEIGEPQTLAGKDKLFCLDTAAHLDGCGYTNHVVPYAQCLPKPLLADGALEVALPVGEEVSRAASLRMRLQTDAETPLTAAINGAEIPLQADTELTQRFGMCWQSGAAPIEAAKAGGNAVLVRRGRAESAINLCSLELAVDYGGNPA